jgi:hypothetical protein
VFERGRVLIEDLRGRVVAERPNARALMGRGRRLLWWDPLDALYFVGYALSTYLRAPFLVVQEGFHVEAVGTLSVCFRSAVLGKRQEREGRRCCSRTSMR